MKKPFSVTDSALTVIRVCLVLGIFISLFNFYLNTRQDSRIVVRITDTGTTVQTQEHISQTMEAKPAADIISPGYDEPSSLEEANLQPDETLSASASATTAAPAATTAGTIVTSSTATPEPAAQSCAGLININEAPESELIKLSGIGEAKAAAIIEYRRTNGKFRKIEDILNVSGIGEKTFEKIRDRITV